MLSAKIHHQTSRLLANTVHVYGWHPRSRRSMVVYSTSAAMPALPPLPSLKQLEGITLPQIDSISIKDAEEGLTIAGDYAGKAAGVLLEGWTNLTSPFAIFGDSWFLNVLFFGTLGLLAYSLLVLAPKQ